MTTAAVETGGPERAGTEDEDQDTEQTGGFGSLGVALGLLVAAWGAVIASFPLNDNSFFTHLATGRIILDTGSVPSSDPYTFTAQGTDWTVQSWLASVVYAIAEQIGGAVGLKVLMLVIFVTAALLLWRLSRPAESIFVRLAVVFGALIVATGLWAERPFMIGVIGLAVVWLALEGAVRAWLLVPLLWIWANSHGSFPLAGVLVLTVLAGEAIDHRRRRADGTSTRLCDELTTELRVLKATVAGSLLAMVGPLGVDVLLFPLKALTQSGALSEIIEWQPPTYQSVSERAFLALTLLTLAALVRDGRFRLALPTILFVGAAVVAQRNVVMATVILVPVLAASAPAFGTLSARSRPNLGPAFTVVAGVAAAAIGVAAVAGPTWSLERYEPRHLAWLHQADPDELGRVATKDTTGNLLELLDGPTGSVFFDDRADMFPEDVFEDYVVLLRGGPEWSSVLADYELDVVVWPRSRPLASLLAVDSEWRSVFSDTRAATFCRRSSPACDRLAS